MRKGLKIGAEVVVIAGNSKGKSGKILQIFKKNNRVAVEGTATQKRHIRKSQQHPDGAIIEKLMPIHESNVMLKEEFDRRASKRASGANQPKKQTNY